MFFFDLAIKCPPTRLLDLSKIRPRRTIIFSGVFKNRSFRPIWHRENYWKCKIDLFTNPLMGHPNQTFLRLLRAWSPAHWPSVSPPAAAHMTFGHSRGRYGAWALLGEHTWGPRAEGSATSSERSERYQPHLSSAQAIITQISTHQPLIQANKTHPNRWLKARITSILAANHRHINSRLTDFKQHTNQFRRLAFYFQPTNLWAHHSSLFDI